MTAAADGDGRGGKSGSRRATAVGGIRLWLVDDTEAHHEVARRTLKGLGRYELESFLTGEDAIAAFSRLARGGSRAGLPAIVLMDFYLGDMRGDQVTRKLREVEPSDHRAVIVGYSSVADASERIRAAGGDVVVRKHVVADGVNPTLRAWLEQWRPAANPRPAG
jgi:CheY-like chemotaxis protein